MGGREHEQDERAEQKRRLEMLSSPRRSVFVPKTFYIWRTCMQAQLSVLANHTPGKGKVERGPETEDMRKGEDALSESSFIPVKKGERRFAGLQDQPRRSSELSKGIWGVKSNAPNL